MRRISWLASLPLIAIFGVLVLIAFLRPTNEKFEEDTQKQIKQGMSAKEVEQIIGCPEGNYGLGKAGVNWDFMKEAILLEGKTRSWFGPKKGIVVIFDWHDRVYRSEYVDVWREHDSNFEHWLIRFGLKSAKTPPWNVSVR